MHKLRGGRKNRRFLAQYFPIDVYVLPPGRRCPTTAISDFTLEHHFVTFSISTVSSVWRWRNVTARVSIWKNYKSNYSKKFKFESKLQHIIIWRKNKQNVIQATTLDQSAHSEEPVFQQGENLCKQNSMLSANNSLTKYYLWIISFSRSHFKGRIASLFPTFWRGNGSLFRLFDVRKFFWHSLSVKVQILRASPRKTVKKLCTKSTL